jgi:hypothetical protein
MKALLVFLCIPFCGFTQTNTLTVNGATFLVKESLEKNEWFEKNDTLLEFYRLENGKPKYLLSHYKYRYSADCNNEFTDKGTYSVTNDSIVFTTYFLQKTGLDPIPEERRQIYEVQADGKLILIWDRQKERSSGAWVETNYK